MKAYHASQVPLEPGSRLESRFFTPQNLFHVHAIESAMNEGSGVLKAVLLAEHIRSSGNSLHIQFAFNEVLLERMRVKFFPERPARNGSIFLSPTIADASAFRALTSNHRPHLYVCEIEHDEPFIADLNLVTSASPLAPITAQIEYLETNGQRYWKGDLTDEPIREILAPSGAVKVTARAEW